MKPYPILRYWCLAGAVIITVVGTLWHYLYAWSGESRMLGAIVPVNESVWEHLKMGYWGLVLFSVIEYLYSRSLVNNYFFAKLTGMLALELSILAIHYSYTTLTGRMVVWVDILSFVAGVALCQYTVYRLYLSKQQKMQREWISLAGFIALGVLFILTTYYPPHYPIFRDKKDNTTGIHKTPY